MNALACFIFIWHIWDRIFNVTLGFCWVQLIIIIIIIIHAHASKHVYFVI